MEGRFFGNFPFARLWIAGFDKFWLGGCLPPLDPQAFLAFYEDAQRQETASEAGHRVLAREWYAQQVQGIEPAAPVRSLSEEALRRELQAEKDPQVLWPFLHVVTEHLQVRLSRLRVLLGYGVTWAFEELQNLLKSTQLIDVRVLRWV